MCIHENIEYDKSKGNVIRCYCARCNTETKHEILTNVKFNWSEDLENVQYTISGFDDCQAVMCRGCDTLSFRQISWFSEDCNPDWNGEICYYYPKRKIRKALEITSMPYKLSELYNEVVSSYNSGALILVAGGLRAIIEGICSVKGIDRGKVPTEKDETTVFTMNKKLQGKIYGLHECGYISANQMDILSELRLLGNKSLHEIEN